MSLAIQRPEIQLRKKLQTELPNIDFLGDIHINDQEYHLLIQHMRFQYNSMLKTSGFLQLDLLSAVALVQIGIRYYNGRYWPYVASELGIESLPVNQQTIIGDAFYKVLRQYGKPSLRRNERVKNILMHGFVSDYYSDSLFNFLFAFYKIDLERDITRLDNDTLKDLLSVMAKNDNTERTYYLVCQTADAIRESEKNASRRVRWLLQLIDNSFWDEEIPENYEYYRLSQKFFEWLDKSQDFDFEYTKFHGDATASRSTKSFSSPYLKYLPSQDIFVLFFPRQLIKTHQIDYVVWRTEIDDDVIIKSVDLLEAVTGFKTEEASLIIPHEKLFSEISIFLQSGDLKFRRFKIDADCMRLFDSNWECLSPKTIPTGTIYGFSKRGELILSDALVDSETRGGLLLSYFEFQNGDFIRFPNGKSTSIGKKPEEGLLPRHRVINAYSRNENGIQLNIYKKPPSVFIKMKPSREKGTKIIINGTPHRLCDTTTVILDFDDIGENKGYLINLSNFGCKDDGIYKILIDVPNDRAHRCWEFVLINSFSYEFEDAPYIFQPRGSICFPKELHVQNDSDYQKPHEENVFQFVNDPDIDELYFTLLSNGQRIPVQIVIPTFKWCFDDGRWHIEKPSEIWHGDFPTVMYFKYPEHRITLKLDNKVKSEYEQSEDFEKRRASNLFECNVTRFCSWFGREVNLRTISIFLSGSWWEFINVVTKSTVQDCIIHGDFERSMLVCIVDIIGKSNYYADLKFNGKTIAEKCPIKNGKLEFQTTLKNGIYSVSVFEEEPNDTGFGTPEFSLLNTFNRELLNPNELGGKDVAIRGVRKIDDQHTFLPLRSCYTIKNIRKLPGNEHCYLGHMYTSEPVEWLWRGVLAKLEFFDLNKLNLAKITLLDHDEEYEFLYDTKKQFLIKDEDRSLPRTEQYRRYTSLYQDEYVFAIKILETDSLPPDI